MDTNNAEAVQTDAGVIIADETPVIEENLVYFTDDVLVPIIFSHDETFYNQDIMVELTTEIPNARIYYTVNGSLPHEDYRNCTPDGFPANTLMYCHHPRDSCTFNDGIPVPAGDDGSDPSCFRASADGSRRLRTELPPPHLYTEPILIESTRAVTATTIKAVAVYDCEITGKEIVSPVATNSYIVGRNVFERFTPETFVFVLSADSYDLNCFYHGVAIEGFLRQQYRSHVWTGGNLDPPSCANFNMRGRPSERDFFVEVYDFAGNTLIHQAAGGRIQGGWSRAASQKSWRLIARSQYSQGKFRHDFFDDTFNYNGQLITRFDRLILRNGANDRDHANIRDELGGRLAKQAGFPDVQSFAPAAVFLNSRYYGFAWLKESLCEGYLVQKYGGKKDNYEIIQKSESGRDGNQRAVDDWEYIYELAEAAIDDDSSVTFTDDKVFEEFTSRVDIDNFILYYAIQTYIDNRDWPGNNMRMWRYYPGEDEIVTSDFNDGKWRFLMYDVEFAFGIYGQGYMANTLGNVLGRRGGGWHMGGRSTLLQAVLQRDDMREKFANTICDLISGAFSTRNMMDTLDEIAAAGDPEMLTAMDAGTVWMWDIAGNREQINQFARRRPEIYHTYMKTIFEIPDNAGIFTAVMNGAEGATAWLNTRSVTGRGNEARTAYYTTYNVPIKAEISAIHKFVSWEINGVFYYENEMTINSSMADVGGVVTIILHTERLTEGMPFVINAVNISNRAGRIELFNPNSVAISTRDYYLSDTSDNLRRWKIPTITVNPQETLIIVTSNNRSEDSLMKPQTNFRLREGETLYLSCRNEGIIAAVLIPEMGRNDVLLRLDDGTYRLTADN
jgi:hypothetical protein